MSTLQAAPKGYKRHMQTVSRPRIFIGSGQRGCIAAHR